MKKGKTTDEPTKTATPEKRRTENTIEYLPVRYTPAEFLDLAQRLARATATLGDVEDQKKANDAEFKETSEGLKLEIKRLSRRMNTGNEMRNVDCQWILEEPTPKEKTLIRMDTKETVRVMPMQDNDFQSELPIAIPTVPSAETLQLTPDEPAKPRLVVPPHSDNGASRRTDFP